MKNTVKLVVTLALGLQIGACSTLQSESNEVKSMIVEPAPDAGFIANPERQRKRTDLPFQKVWIKPDFDKSQYRELVVAPVNTQYMMEMDWMHKLSSANILGNVKNDIEELAVYFHDQVVTAFTKDPQRRFRILESADQHSEPALRLELALIEIEPSSSALHALSWAGPPGTGTAAGLVNKRRAAFEARLRDLQTQEIVATFADRDMQDAGPLDLTRLTWYGPAKGILERWAGQFVQVANRKPEEVITDPTAFTLKPF